MTNAASDPPSRLSRRLGTFDAVMIGLGSMIGAGVFGAIGPAAAAAGGGLLVGLAVAAVVAYLNASSSAQLAAIYPRSGGAYVYGHERLGHLWGFFAGWGFVIGKIASCAAMALTFGAYASPDLARPLAVGAVVWLTAVNLKGIRATAGLARVIVALVLGSLASVVVASSTAKLSWERIGPLGEGGLPGVLQASGILFFAFAGYARIATLGEEVREPARTIPRAIMCALAITLAVYVTVATTALMAVGPAVLADSSAPLAAAVRAGTMSWAVPVTRVGASIASLGVLLSLLAGVSRTTFAMAEEGDLPRWLAGVHAGSHAPHRAQILISGIVVMVAMLVDLRGAIGFSSFAVLLYYGITNASAWTLRSDERRSPRSFALLGMVGCMALAFSLPIISIITGFGALLAGLTLWAVRQRMRPDES
ncbi:MAG: APC family permease [Actinomycetota bacterium]